MRTSDSSPEYRTHSGEWSRGGREKTSYRKKKKINDTDSEMIYVTDFKTSAWVWPLRASLEANYFSISQVASRQTLKLIVYK